MIPARIAKIYAANVGVSVNRPEDKDVLPATPTVIGFVPVSGQAELKISLLGKPYFVHASKMQVVRSTPVSREEIEWLHAQEALSPKRVAEF